MPNPPNENLGSYLTGSVPQHLDLLANAWTTTPILSTTNVGTTNTGFQPVPNAFPSENPNSGAVNPTIGSLASSADENPVLNTGGDTTYFGSQALPQLSSFTKRVKNLRRRASIVEGELLQEID